MSVPAGFKGLRFPCECVSSRPGRYSDPWAEITKNKLLPNGTKEEILNALAQGPKTINQIAEVLGRSTNNVPIFERPGRKQGKDRVAAAEV